MTTQGLLRHLYVAWRRPDGLIVPVGRLSQHVAEQGTTFRFVYLKMAERQHEFVPLPGLPYLHQAYEDDALFPVFGNRVMPRERPDYEHFLEQLDLPLDTDPFEVLARSEGIRATDRVEVFPAPLRVNDDLTTVFFARGIRHLEGAGEAVSDLSPGDLLTLERELDNPVNDRAMLMSSTTGSRVGWIPDYLLDLLYELDEINGSWPVVSVEHVNDDRTPAHLRLLCRLTAPWPRGYEPFSGPDFQPLSD